MSIHPKFYSNLDLKHTIQTISKHNFPNLLANLLYYAPIKALELNIKEKFYSNNKFINSTMLFA